MLEIKYCCPCCGFRTLSRKPPGSYGICPVCYWEDDAAQFDDPTADGDGANGVSLDQARKNFKEFGASEREALEYVRPPNPEESSPDTNR
jgi:hypothetical protein